ncbi:MAG: OmpA family protein [Gemmatimonadaceae bacterium]
MRTLNIFGFTLTLALSVASCSHTDAAAATATVRAPASAGESTALASNAPLSTPPAPATADGEAPSVAASTLRIPFIEGLTTVSAVSDANGDYESFGMIQSIEPNRYKLVVSAELKDEDGGRPKEISVPRSVRLADERNGHTMRHYFHTGDALQFTGTMPDFSPAMVNELRSAGRTSLTFIEAADAFGMSVVQRTLSGTIARVEPQPVAVPMLVNDIPTQLPAIHVKGTLSDEDSHDEFEFYVLDDPANPLLLRKRGPGFSSSVIRIEYPEPVGRRRRFEEKLAANEPVDVYGIYFSFNRADIRPESDSVLKEIADVMKKNSTWHLRLDGNTDGIGNPVANQQLSERRAASVKDALVTRYGIEASRLTTGGHGASNPKDRNDTPEGRARNRRVELRRE